MDLQLEGKSAVVTGASKGIGLAITRLLAEEGVAVTAGALDTESLDGLENVDGVAIDLVEASGPSHLVAHAFDRNGTIDILVNNLGGVAIRTEGFAEVGDDKFQRAFDLNFFPALRMIRAVVPRMISAGGGVIVNVVSVNAFFQPDGATIDYGAAKAALLNLGKSLSQELAPHGIRVNSVSPGPVATDLWLGEHGVADTLGKASGVSADEVRAQATAGIPTHRFSTPEEVAFLVVALASSRSGNVNGSDFVIDGGLVKTM